MGGVHHVPIEGGPLFPHDIKLLGVIGFEVGIELSGLVIPLIRGSYRVLIGGLFPGHRLAIVQGSGESQEGDDGFALALSLVPTVRW